MLRLAVCGLLFIAGCPAEPEPEPTAQERFVVSCLALAEAHCQRRQACALRLGRTQDLAACKQAKRSACKGSSEAAPGKPFEDFDPVAAQACIDATAQAECAVLDDRWPLLPECRAHFGANAAARSPCISDFDCADGWCFNDDQGCGQCQSYAQVGDDCSARESRCGFERACVRGRDATFLCRPRRDLEFACESDLECGPSLFCHPERARCEPQRAPGDVCHGDPDIDDCRYDSVCISGICTAGIALDEDDLCDAPDRLCPVGTFCSSTSCLAIKAVGEACSEDVACGAAAACVGGFCRLRGGEGAPCDRPRSCRGGLTCFEDKCALLEVCE
jgi:hypothetical protein